MGSRSEARLLWGVDVVSGWSQPLRANRNTHTSEEGFPSVGLADEQLRSNSGFKIRDQKTLRIPNHHEGESAEIGKSTFNSSKIVVIGIVR